MLNRLTACQDNRGAVSGVVMSFDPDKEMQDAGRKFESFKPLFRMSRKRLGLRMGYAPSSLIQFEKGETSSIKAWMDLCYIIGIEFSSLFDREDNAKLRLSNEAIKFFRSFADSYAKAVGVDYKAPSEINIRVIAEASDKLKMPIFELLGCHRRAMEINPDSVVFDIEDGDEIQTSLFE